MGLSKGTKIIELLSELENLKWDVILLSETRIPTGKYVLEGGHVLFTSLSNNAFSGTGILLNVEHVRKSNKIHCVTDRVLVLDFMAYSTKLRAVAVYVLHAGYSVEDFEETFDQLQSTIQTGRFFVF